MKALDTNVIIRFLVRDDKQQAEIVYRLFKRVERKNETLFVPLLVVLETLWVLESVYEYFTRGNICVSSGTSSYAYFDI